MSEDAVFVVDIGSSSIKAGFCGEDSPSYVYPSFLSRSPHPPNLESIEGWVSDGFLTNPPNSVLQQQPIQRGVVQNWDHMKELWDHIKLTANLGSIENTTSIFVVESARWTTEDRAQMARLLFDDHAPSVCFGSSSALSIFASGRTSGLAVECGSGTTTVSPIFEGLVLKHAVTAMDYGGQDITYTLRKMFAEQGIHMDLSSAKSVKESYAYIPGFASPSLQHTQKEAYTFCLPDGNDVTVNTKVFRECTAPLMSNDKIGSGGLISQVCESIILCDESIRKELANNIILSGGNSMLPGLGDILNNSVSSNFRADSDYKISPLSNNVRVVPTSRYREPGYTLQRKFAPWIGGSLMASFDTYHQSLKISRQDWEENHEVALSIKNL